MKQKNFVFQTWERLTGRQNVNPVQGQTFKQVGPAWEIKSFKLVYLFLILVIVSLAGVLVLQGTSVFAKVIEFESPIRIPPQSIAPTSPTAGMMYYDSDDNRFYYYSGSAWLELISENTDIDTTCGTSGVCATVYQGASSLASLYITDGNTNWDNSYGYITASGVPAAETDAAHDTCTEISGCVVGAITDGNTGWNNSYGFIDDGNTNWDNSYGYITSAGTAADVSCTNCLTSTEVASADIAYDLSCTNCIGTTEIVDSYVLNSSDTMTGYLYVNDYIIALGGIHVGGSSDPGTDNLIVDGEIRVNAANLLSTDGFGSSNTVFLRDDDVNWYIAPWGTGTTANEVVVGGAFNTNFRVTGKTTINGSITIEGTIQAGDTTPLSNVAYHRFGTGMPDKTGYITSYNDVYISDDFEVDGKSFFGGGYGAGDLAETLNTKKSREHDYCNGDVSCLKDATDDDLDYGDVVCIDPTVSESIKKCDEANSSLVIGAISKSTAIFIGDESGYPVAVAGLVYTNITNENGDIVPGDLLVTSSKPGYAMKSSDEPKQGTIMGKAFDFCNEKECSILIFVALN